MVCPVCQYPVEAGARCCGECGFRFGSDVHLVASERRDRDTAVSSPQEPAEDASGVKESDTIASNQEFGASDSVDFVEASKVVKLDAHAWGHGLFDIGIDTLVPFVSEISNSLRILFVANDSTIEHVEMSIAPQGGTCSRHKRSFDVSPGVKEHEFLFGVSGLNNGTVPCDLDLMVIANGVSQSFSGSFEMPVTASKDVGTPAAENISIYIRDAFNNAVTSSASPGGDVRVKIGESTGSTSQEILKRFQRENPLDVIGNLVKSGSRSYRRVEMLVEGGLKPLPTMRPMQKAKKTEVQLAFGSGYRRHIVQFFIDDEICIGHSVDGVREADIIIDAPIADDEKTATVYGRISRRHCMLSRKGPNIDICDGIRLNNGNRRICIPSTNGTVFNGERLENLTKLEDGVLKLGTARDAVTLTLNLITPRDCNRCPIAVSNRISCAGGHCPCVIISRNDSVDVRYVALWGCFDLGVIDKNFSGVEVFYHDGTFCWRRGLRAGWLEDGVDFGLSQYGQIAVSPIWNANHLT